MCFQRLQKKKNLSRNMHIFIVGIHFNVPPNESHTTTHLQKNVLGMPYCEQLHLNSASDDKFFHKKSS